jgi:hypothetical protein
MNEDYDNSNKLAQSHQDEPKTVLHIPVEPIDEAMERAIEADGKSVHAIKLNELDSAFNALFLVCRSDSQLIGALDAAFVYMIDETQYEHATVCGIGVGVAVKVIGSLLADGPVSLSEGFSRNAAQVRAQVAAEFPDTVQRLFGLEVERNGLARNDGAEMAKHHYPEAGNEEGES